MAKTLKGLQQELALYAHEYIRSCERGDKRMAKIYEVLGYEVHQKLNLFTLKKETNDIWKMPVQGQSVRNQKRVRRV